ncbi:hypothetical protein [Streptococcus cristatus]|nr:hypothetical protein [Streptococcus cristatus]
MLEFKRINNVQTYTGGVRDVLVVRQSSSPLIQVEIRVNGYLLDLITVKRNILRVYTLKNLSPTARVTVSNITGGLDMTLKHNRTFRDFDFFEKLK